MQNNNIINMENGIVAVLDALGASAYSDFEIAKFINNREKVLELLSLKAMGVFGDACITERMISTFTFNDTIVCTLRTGNLAPTMAQIGKFFTILRKFFVDSLKNGILFRGSLAIGTFYCNEETNTVLGEAVTDAAAWYDKADWIGIHATPRTSLIIERWIEKTPKYGEELFLNYAVPLKTGGPVSVKVVNWPMVFFTKEITPCQKGETAREKLLEFLTLHQIRLGTEQKFTNTLKLFDFGVEEFRKRQQTKKTIAKQGAKN